VPEIANPDLRFRWCRNTAAGRDKERNARAGAEKLDIIAFAMQQCQGAASGATRVFRPKKKRPAEAGR
jgi:hypothetical protein